MPKENLASTAVSANPLAIISICIQTTEGMSCSVGLDREARNQPTVLRDISFINIPVFFFQRENIRLVPTYYANVVDKLVRT